MIQLFCNSNKTKIYDIFLTFLPITKFDLKGLKLVFKLDIQKLIVVVKS